VCAVWRSELLTTLSEDVLVERTVVGDNSAFEEIMRRYSQPIYAFISNYVGDYDTAQDAFQEAFVRAYKNLRKYRVGTNFPSWLHKVALNASKDCLKKRRRNEQQEVRESEEFDPLSLVPARGPSLQEHAERRELRTAVRGALKQLSDVHRQAVLLYQFQGFSYEEIAAIIGCPLGTVKSRIHYAMRRLQELLAPTYQEYRS